MTREELLIKKEELEKELVRITKILILNNDMVKIYEELQQVKKELEEFTPEDQI